MIAPPLPSEALATFVVFAERLNFTHAARALHLSQPAVFQHIQRLSEALGVELYRRQGHRLELTREGMRVAAFARGQAEETARLRDELEGREARVPSVLCAGEGAYLYLLGEAVSRLLAAGEALRLMTRNGEGTLEALLVGEAHVGVAVVERVPDELEAAVLQVTPQVLAVPRSHPLARRKRCRLKDLDGERLVVPPRGRPLRAALELATRAAGVPWQPAVEASSWPLQLHFVKLGVGLAVVNGCCRLPPGLVGVPVPELPASRYLKLRRRGPQDAARGRLWEALRGDAAPRGEAG